MSGSSYKLLVLGNAGVGKTSIIKRFINNEFTQDYTPTVAVDFSMENVELTEPIITMTPDYIIKSTERQPNNTQLIFWDVAGSEKSDMTKVYYKDANAAIIVFDMSTDKTFSSITTWLHDLRSIMNVPVFVFGNKSDLTHYDTDPLIEYCENNNIDRWYLISALENNYVTESIHSIVDVLTNKSAAINALATSDLN